MDFKWLSSALEDIPACSHVRFQTTLLMTAVFPSIVPYRSPRSMDSENWAAFADTHPHIYSYPRSEALTAAFSFRNSPSSSAVRARPSWKIHSVASASAVRMIAAAIACFSVVSD